MNFMLRAFINAYASLVGRSDYEDLSLLWTFAFPLRWFLRSTNRHAHSAILPAPKLYRFQARSEIRFQAQRFVDRSLASLNRVDASFAAMQQLHNTSALFPLLVPSIDAVNLQQHQLNRTMDGLKDPTSWRESMLGLSSAKRQELRQLREHYARSERIRTRINMLMQIVPIYTDDSARLRAELYYMRSSFHHIVNLDFAVDGVIALPPTLEAQIGLPPFSWLRPDWDQGPGDTEGNTTASRRYHYNLDRVGDTDTRSLLSAVARLCEQRVNRETVNGALYMICNIWNYARTFSELDDDLFGGVQRSWVRERLEVVRSYDKGIRADHQYISLLAANLHGDYRSGKRVPEYIH